ncbi:MAG: hypothetical protein KTR29_00410 [Rhodothermaceae bacterium]|nr:hypothetical protein [Rhodothermaceae bacterium]
MKALSTQYKSRLILGITFVILFASSAWAQTSEPTEEQKKQIASQIEHSKELLQLTDDQVVAVDAILTTSFSERLGIMEKYGINFNDPNYKRPGMSTLRRMGREMDKLKGKTNKQLEEHLTSDQMETWEMLEEDRSARMRERLLGRN